MNHRHPSQPGFTLIELLVVISIIALLIGILLPVLGSARAAGRSIQCLSNIRQMGVAAAAHHAEHRGRYPIAYDEPFGSITWEISWDGSAFVPGTLWQGQGTTEIQQCPSFDGPSNWGSQPYSGYNYNTSYLGHGSGEAVPTPARIDQLSTPTRTAVFGDGGYSGGANKFMRAPHADVSNGGDNVNDATRAAGTQAYRHQDATNVVFADGHGQTVADRATAANPGVDEAAGFLAEDNTPYDLN